jgi:DNA (cytosine-5)-methyltransferase 1
MIKVGGQFSGVGAFDLALIRLGIDYQNVYQAEWDKYARQTYLHNYEDPIYYVQDVHDTPTKEITDKFGSLDIAMFSPPCQAFSLAGKRLGKADKRGVLFFNSHEFIQVNKPRFFIFENVKGLLSDANGKTFSEWLNYLGSKSVNGNPVLFPVDEAVPYHIYWKVLNAKDYNVPQNRERVFIVGIRDDSDNNFSWPKEETLTKRLKNVLEDNVPDKYFLSEKMVSYLVNRSDNFNAGKINFKTENDSASCLTKSSSSIDISDNIIVVGNTNPCGHGQNGNVYDDEGLAPTLSTNKGEGIKIKSATSKGYELATENDSINFSVPNPETIPARAREDGSGQPVIKIKINENKIRFHRDDKRKSGIQGMDAIFENGIADSITTNHSGNFTDGFKIRRLTPRECFRLMDFPDSFTWTVSDSQAYKQAGNSIVVKMLELIISRLNILPPVQP